MPLTPFQRASIKRHLGYPLITATETLRSGMLPSGPDDLTFAMEKAFDNVIPEAEKMILTIVEKLECIEKQLGEQVGDLAVLAVGSTQLAGQEGMGAVEAQYRKWAQKLSDTIGVPMYRHSQYQREIGTFAGRVIEPC